MFAVPEENSFSVVVASRNRAHLLARLVEAIEAQSLRPMELVIVDDASEDSTWEVLTRHAGTSTVNIVPVHLARNLGPGGARNAGWRRARGSVVAFTDDDCVPQPDWLHGLASRLSAGADLVQGRTLPDPAQAGRHGPFSRTIDVGFEGGYYQTCNIAYRREVLEQLGGFDERFRRSGEDTDLALRAIDAGARASFAVDAIVLHDVRPSNFLVHLRDTERWAGVVLAVRQHPQLRERFHRRWFWKPSHPPALLALAGVLGMMGSRGCPVRAGMSLALMIPYLRYRTRVLPLRGSGRCDLAVVPLALVADLGEVTVMAVSSVRYRTLLL